VFVDGAALLDYDPTLRSQASTTMGVSAGVGLFVSPSLSARVEFDLPQWHSSRYSGRDTLPTRVEAYSLHEENRGPSISILAGGHLRVGPRVSVGLLGGTTLVTRSWRNSGVVEYFGLDGTLIEHRDVATGGNDHRWLALTAGADATIALTRKLAVVPQLRVHSYLMSDHTSLVFVRPRVALRWHF
jgi:hypothetical protein